MEDLKGKMIYGFKFSDGPGYTPSMKDLVGKLGVIISQHDKLCQVKFPRVGVWSYPYPEILDHLVEKEKTIEEIIIELKQITSELWKTKM